MEKEFIPKLNELIHLAQLPGLPNSAIRLLELSQDPENGPAEFAVPVESDPGLTGQVLRYVNSSYFGFVQEISNIKMAITLVGVHTIKNFTLWNAVFSLMSNPRYGPFELKHLWQDSLRRALFAKDFAKLLGKQEAEDVFAAALLQDMAIPIVAKETPQSYAKLLKLREQGKKRLSKLERLTFGWQHAQAGGMMARHWKLPDILTNLIENHVDIEKCADNPKADPSMVAVCLSALLPTLVDPVWTECQQFESYYEKFPPRNKPSVVEMLNKTDEDVKQFAPLLKILPPQKSLVDIYNEAAILA